MNGQEYSAATEALIAFHRMAGPALGEIAVAIETRRMTRRRLRELAELLRSAAGLLDALADSGAPPRRL